jgi:hypothetical protein
MRKGLTEKAVELLLVAWKVNIACGNVTDFAIAPDDEGLTIFAALNDQFFEGDRERSLGPVSHWFRLQLIASGSHKPLPMSILA